MYRLYSIACNKHPYRRFPRKIASAPSSQAYINLDSSSGRFTWWTSPTTILEPKIYRAIVVATLNSTGILILNKIHFYTSSIVPLRIKCKKIVSFSYLWFHATSSKDFRVWNSDSQIDSPFLSFGSLLANSSFFNFQGHKVFQSV